MIHTQENKHNKMKTAKIDELKQLEKQAARIARKRERLEAQVKADREAAKWYDQVLKESGYKRAKDFVKALMGHFGIRTVNLTKGARGPGRPPKNAKAGKPAVKKAKAAAKRPAKRTRTVVNAELRDKVKAALAKGGPKSAVAKEFKLSYPVVKKIGDGGYDKL